MMDADFWADLLRYFEKIIEPAIWATLRMTFWSMFFSLILGFALSYFLVMTNENGLRPNKKWYAVMDFIINTIRSFPIIILIVAISPLTRLAVGTTVGEKAAILPLTVAATPFIARIIENSFLAVDKQLIEATRSFGMTDRQIFFKVLMKESWPQTIAGITLSIITFLSATTLAGAVGAGGLGAVALNYGYQSFNNTILYTSVLLLMVMVQIIQMTGNWLYKKSIQKK